MRNDNLIKNIQRDLARLQMYAALKKRIHFDAVTIEKLIIEIKADKNLIYLTVLKFSFPVVVFILTYEIFLISVFSLIIE